MSMNQGAVKTKAWREANSVTQEQLGRMVDRDISTVSRWESGHIVPSTGMIALLFAVTGIPHAAWMENV